MSTTAPAAAAQTADWFKDAPTGDLSFDALFPPEGTSAPPEPETTQVPTPPTEEFFLKASSSVYKTSEDAIKGIEEKDALIGQLRTRYIEQTGTDPITGKQVAPTTPVQPESESYYKTPDRYFQDLVSAVEQKQPDKYLAAQRRLIMETLAPYAPAIQGFARQQAVDKVSSEVKEAREFLGSPNYQKTLEAMPLLGDAIRNAEQNPQFQEQLPQLYKTAYLVAQGLSLPELLKTQAPAQAPVTPRPTMGSTTMTPPTQAAPREDLGTSLGRKAIIERLEGRVGNLPW
jgi:hypothetical protein